MGDGKAEPGGAGRRGVLAAVEAMRPRHWIKNAFVLAPLLFAGRFADPLAWLDAVIAAGAFCLLSSAVYVTNDLFDRHADRAHPTKRNRAIASGRLSAGAAVATIVVAAAGGLALAAGQTAMTFQPSSSLHGYGLPAWVLAFLVLNLLYSLWLKNHAIVDVIVVAFGFVLRAMAGASAINVPISPWLVVCTFTLCLFIALTKRRCELAEVPDDISGAARSAMNGYGLADIDYMLTVSTALAIVTYMLYCLAPRTVARVGSANMIWTIPLVVYGLFRFHRLSRRQGGQDPVMVVLHDNVLWLVLLAYAVLAGLIVRWGSHPAVRTILDADDMYR